MTPQITVDRNYVVIQGVMVERPHSMSPTQWLEWFEQDHSNIEELEYKIEELQDEIKTLNSDVQTADDEKQELLDENKILKAKIKAVEDALY